MQSLGSSSQGIFLLGKTKPDNLIIPPIGIKHRHRNDRHANFARHPLGKGTVRQFGKSGIAGQLKVSAATRQ